MSSPGLLAVGLALTAAACTGGSQHPETGRSPSPQVEASHSTITVTPAKGLHPGQHVDVRVSGFPAGAKVWLSECAERSDANPIGCGGQLARQPFVVTDDHGAAHGPFLLRGLAATGALRRPSVPCRYTCVLVATVGGLRTPTVRVASLRFAAPASAVGVAVLRVRPAVGLRTGQDVLVDLFRFLPGEKVWLSECAPTEQPTRTGCEDQVAIEPFTVTDDSGIRRGVAFRVTAHVHNRRCVPSCTIAAVGDDEIATAHISFR